MIIIVTDMQTLEGNILYYSIEHDAAVLINNDEAIIIEMDAVNSVSEDGISFHDNSAQAYIRTKDDFDLGFMVPRVIVPQYIIEQFVSRHVVPGNQYMIIEEVGYEVIGDPDKDVFVGLLYKAGIVQKIRQGGSANDVGLSRDAGEKMLILGKHFELWELTDPTVCPSPISSYWANYLRPTSDNIPENIQEEKVDNYL